MALGLNYEGSLQLVIIEREVPAERIKLELSRKAWLRFSALVRIADITRG